MVELKDFVVKTLGNCRVDSPLGPLLAARQRSIHNVDETDRVLFDDIASEAIARDLPASELPGFEPAGPRKKIYFDPSKTRAGIVTCADALLVGSETEVAVTVKALPGVDPAVKRPLFDIAPPVAVHVTATFAVNCLVCPDCTVALAGEIETCIG